MHAHQAIAARPVDLGHQPGAGAGHVSRLGQPVHDLPVGPGGVGDLERGAVGEQEAPPIARLAAALAVEDGAMRQTSPAWAATTSASQARA